MAFRNYRLNLLARIILILVNSLLIGFLFFTQHSFIYTIVFLFILLIVQAGLLLRFLEKSTRSLTRFLDYARDHNTGLSFRKELNDGVYRELGDVLDQINGLIREARIEKENHYQYLQYVIQNAGTGLIAYSENGRIELCNEEALHILDLPALYDMRVLQSRYNAFAQLLSGMIPQEQKTFRLIRTHDALQLTIRCSEFSIQKKRIRLFSFHDIKAELEERELDSWQKLIRVLTHEIMNSLTPINTIASGLLAEIEKNRQDKILDEKSTGMKEGLELIAERGSGLMDFIRRYRTLTRLPEPNFREINLNDLLSRIMILMKAEADLHSCTLEAEVIPEDLSLTADERMLEQVLINLVKNSLQALQQTTNGKIKMQAMKISERIAILVSDNGPGIPEELLPEIFTPFFTTREHGSGIGLSLARQIMRLHRGSITARKNDGSGTTMELTF